jgi:large subunit ribosomal protein L18
MRRSRIDLFHVRHQRVREKISGTAQRPRMAVRISNRYMHIQFIDDSRGVTLAYASSQTIGNKNNMTTARALGDKAVKCAVDAGIHTVVVDRGGHRYHGRVKVIVETMAKAGLVAGVAPDSLGGTQATKEDGR